MAKIEAGIEFTESRIEALEDSFKELELENRDTQREQVLQQRAILYDTLQILRNRKVYALTTAGK
jgi:hypothetical protein